MALKTANVLIIAISVVLISMIGIYGAVTANDRSNRSHERQIVTKVNGCNHIEDASLRSVCVTLVSAR